MCNGAYWIWCDIDGHGKRWHLAFTKRSDFGDDDEIVFPLDDFDDIAENYSDYPVQAVVAPKPLRPIPQTEDEAAEAADNGRNTGGKSYR